MREQSSQTSQTSRPSQPSRKHARRRSYLVVSDLHLCDVEDHPDRWKAFKHSRHVFDETFAAAVDRFVGEASRLDARARAVDGASGQRHLVLVLNGDIIDFDLVCAVPNDPPWPVSRVERKCGLEATEEKSLWKLERVLAYHPLFVETLARFLARGHEVVWVLGNHDGELWFDRLQRTLRRAVRAAAARLGLGPVDADGLIAFEPWFYYVSREIYVEHGHQYDFYSSFRYVLNPVVSHGDGQQRIALSMGNLANRRLLSWLGFFNPHATDFILNIYRYVLHWLKHYAFTRRNLVFAFLAGSLGVIWRLLRTKRRLLRAPPPGYRDALASLSRRMDLPAKTVERLDALKQPPITNRVYRMVRELWIDRILLALVMTGGTIALAVAETPLWVKLMVPLCSFPLLYLLYESFAQGETVFTIESEIHKYALAIAELLPARLIVLGHTHQPEMIPLLPGVSYVNTGTWAPVPRAGAPDELRPGLQNVLIAHFEQPAASEPPAARLETCHLPSHSVCSCHSRCAQLAAAPAIESPAPGGPQRACPTATGSASPPARDPECAGSRPSSGPPDAERCSACCGNDGGEEQGGEEQGGERLAS